MNETIENTLYVTCPLCGERYQKETVEEDVHACPPDRLLD